MVNGKTNKNTRILMLYQRLLNGQHVDKASYVVEHGINERSFDRDIEDIRIFLSEIYSTNEVVYDKLTKSYYLTRKMPKYIDCMDATTMAMILLSSKTLRKDEMNGLVKIILSMVSSTDADVILKTLSCTMERYESHTTSAILKLIGDLCRVISKDTDIELSMVSDNGENVKVKVSPLEIELNDSIFYLVCARELDFAKIAQIKIEEIKSFKVLNSIFAKSYKEKYYKVKEKRYNGN